MKEKGWLAGDYPMEMWAFVRDKASDRKFRLVLCELMRRDRTVRSPDALKAIALGEQLADNAVTDKEIRAFNRATLRGDSLHWTTLTTNPKESVKLVIGTARTYLARRIPHLLHEVFGNPFRSATVDPAWLTSTVVALAEGIYAESAFDRMPILADALQDADCDNDDILSHCRDTKQTHVRGCWVIDLLTGRA